ncbi:DUF6453 family protein [Citrobacter amalonaticus]|uniref:DUF6453 family protein n=1 Tax=Citrobacter amalonaticus TaxID=35703 RepID=UPI00076B6FF1|nr:DUF6453 family protein [Citrobacter amalonaticus]AMG94336.1 hypothetical protein AL479_18470 [Citrobacter amalonaticus]ELK6622274.1 hypothetical protein [Citrobacter amalonaticus]HED1255373.1 hypothetical protein [Citrobacter amalonaticus]
MPEGILIDYNDGRPVMAITAGLRAPSFCTSFSGLSSQESQYPVNTSLVAGSQVIVIPTNPISIIDFSYYDVAMMGNVARNGNSGVIISVETLGGGSFYPDWSGYVMEILSAQTYNEGLFVSSSTNFTAISNAAKLMTCAYTGRITVNGSAPLPVSGIPFGKWSNPNVSVGFDGANIIVRDISYSGRDDVAGSATIDLVIFNQTAPVGGDGITMTNAAGQVTFSTRKRPFVYDRQLQITDSFQNINNGFCQITYTGVQVRMNGGYGNLRTKGVVMSNGNVRSAYNKVVGNYYSNGWDMTRNRNITMPILILPNMY